MRARAKDLHEVSFSKDETTLIRLDTNSLDHCEAFFLGSLCLRLFRRQVDPYVPVIIRVQMEFVKGRVEKNCGTGLGTSDEIVGPAAEFRSPCRPCAPAGTS